MALVTETLTLKNRTLTDTDLQSLFLHWTFDMWMAPIFTSSRR